ncbi:MAG: hypothetical protein ACKVHE_29650 [Planctomycetales bacterium]|jgi:hypothetical protein
MSYARDLGISKAALKKSLSRIRAVAAELGEGFLDAGLMPSPVVH